MPQITLTLEQLDKFLKKLSPKTIVRDKAFEGIKSVLKESFRRNVFTTHTDTVNISTKSELRRLIRSKGIGKKGKAYNKEYLERKSRLGEHQPHKYTEYGFWDGTSVKIKNDQVVMETEQPTDARKSGKFKRGLGDYLSYHETQRSVLKLAFLRAWQDIISTTINTYKEEAEKC